MTRDTLKKRLAFLQKLEELKLVERANLVLEGRRQENSAEHSWHVAMMALILAPESEVPLDLFRVVKMLLIHDIVEIEAGDTFLYSEETATQKEREEKALENLSRLLPSAQKESFCALWHEMERLETPEAKFAKVMDLFQPIMNYHQVNIPYTEEKKVKKSQVIEKKQLIAEVFPTLWEIALRYIEECTENGLYEQG